MNFSRLRIPAVAMAILVTLAAYGHLSAGEADIGADPLPFDPLSEAEQEQAIQLALADPAVSLLLSDHYETIGASLHSEKTEAFKTGTVRLADVWFYDYTTNTVVWPIVDLKAGAVRELVDVPETFQPPLTQGENVRAGDIALADPDVQALITYEVDATTAHLWTGPDSPCPIARCVIVGFYDHVGNPQFGFWALVDLSTNEVRDIIDNDWFIAFEEAQA